MITEFTNHPVKTPYNTYRAFCKEVYDGDTYTMLVDLGFYTYTTIRIRVLGIDTPEMRDSDPAIRAKAKLARDRAAELLLNKPCIITTQKDAQSFDRWIATVSVVEGTTHTDIATVLLSEGHAIPYTK